MKKMDINKISAVIINLSIIGSIFFVQSAISGTLTVQEQEPAYKYATKPSEGLFIQKTPSVDKLVSNVTAGVAQGVDTNPLLDSTHKADNYTQEAFDTHFTYPVFGSFLGFTNSKFGFNVTNTNYYNITDVNIMDGIADVNIEQEIFDQGILTAGYAFEYMLFPNDENGTFAGNQINVGVQQNLSDRAYQKAAYRLMFKSYLSRKARLGNFNFSADKRFDVRNIFEHEVGMYIGDQSKFKVTNQFYINDSNDQYFDFYNYYNYRFGLSAIQFITKKLYNITGFYYQRRNYMSRKVSGSEAKERDNLYLVTTSFLYDIKKDISVFVNYSHSENHTNEPLERYIDTLYSAGLYYSF